MAAAAKPRRQDRRRGQGRSPDSAGRPARCARFPDDRPHRLTNGIAVEYVQRHGSRSPRSRWLSMPAMRRTSRRARPRSDDHGPARRGNLEAQLAADRGGRGTARRRRQQRPTPATGPTLSLNALSPNLAPSLDLMSEIVKDAAFRPDDIERIRAQTLTAIAADAEGPDASRARGCCQSSSTERASLWRTAGRRSGGDRKFTRADLLAFQQRWLRPDNAKIFVVSDRPLSEVQPLIEARFGNWAPPAAARAPRAFTAPPARPTARRSC